MTFAYADDPVAGLPVDAAGLARRALLPLGVGLAYLSAYLLTLVMPFVVNDLHTLPLAEAAGGGHDPKDLWPTTTPWGELVGLAALLVMATGPLLVLAAGGWAAVALVVRRRVLDRRARVVLVCAVVTAVVFLGLFFSPFGMALSTWRAD